MTFLRFFVPWLGLACGLASAATPDSARALAIAQPYRLAPGEAPAKVLHVCYFTPADVAPAAGYEERIDRIMRDIQGFYRKGMERHGFGPATFRLAEQPGGRLRLHLVKGAKPASAYSYESRSGHELRAECAAVLAKEGIAADNETIVLFCNLSAYDGKSIRQFSPYYGGGTAFSGTAWLCDSPILDTRLLPEKAQKVDDAQYGRISVGRYNSIFIGGTAHELGHGLGLPHNRERPDEATRGTALMGSGNRTYGEELRGEGKGSFLTFAHALRLLSHPLFGGAKGGRPGQPDLALSEVAAIPAGPGFTFRGRVGSSVPVHAVVAYLDPTGGDDYDATTATAVPDADGRFTLDCQALRRDSASVLRVVFCHADGNTTTRSWSFAVGKDGKPDLDCIRLPLLMEGAIAAAVRGDAKAFAAEAARLRQAPDPAVARILPTLEQSLVPEASLKTPTELATGQAKELALAGCRTERKSVGWGRPTRNRLPELPGLLVAGGRTWATGLYAHAPASHAWALGGKWGRLHGHAGLAAGHDGSVVFVIRGDGRELWRSPLVKDGKLVAYDVALAGVAQLELATEPGPDGNGSDWALWLEPRLGAPQPAPAGSAVRTSSSPSP